MFLFLPTNKGNCTQALIFHLKQTETFTQRAVLWMWPWLSAFQRNVYPRDWAHALQVVRCRCIGWRLGFLDYFQVWKVFFGFWNFGFLGIFRCLIESLDSFMDWHWDLWGICFFWGSLKTSKGIHRLQQGCGTHFEKATFPAISKQGIHDIAWGFPACSFQGDLGREPWASNRATPLP